MKHVLVLGAQVPFIRGGAELLNESLVKEINKLDGIKAELVQIPFKWYPEEQILSDIMAWRLLDITETNGVKIDLVIATKFPTYAVNHSNKVLWLVHQYRQMYDLKNTEYDGVQWDEQSAIKSIEIRKKIKNLDNKFFKECRKIYTIAETVSDRLKMFNGFSSTALSPPPVLSEKIRPGTYKDYVLYVGRLDPIKRVDLLIKGLAQTQTGKAFILGTGNEYKNLEKLVYQYKLENRCKLLGYVSDDELIKYLSDARAVFYAPVDEDYGYATIEAFLAHKPVITCHDSGEVQKMVSRTGSGIICDTNEQSVAEAINEIFNMSDKKLKKMSLKGYNLAQSIKWKEVIQKLVLDNLE